MSGPAVSVVIPTGGRSSLRRCLEAIARARAPDGGFEVVIAPDGPHAVDLPGYRDEAGIRVAPGPGTGPASARNAGLAAATGELIAFTDDDCEPTPGWLPALTAAAAKAPGAAIGGRTINGFPNNACSEAAQAVVDAFIADHVDRRGPRFFASSNVAFPAARLREIDGFDERYPNAAGEDRDLCHRWVTAGERFVYAPAAVVRHMREMDLGELWRQQRGYGEGARAFHAAHGDLGPAAVEGGFLGELSERIRRTRTVSRPRLAALVALSQIATTLGYLPRPSARRGA